MAGYHFDPQDYKELQNIVDFASDMVATPFDASKSYAVGEYCRRESGFYVRNTAGSGAWDASKWTPTTVGDVLKAANAEISALNATLTQLTPLTPSSGTWTPNIPRAALTAKSGQWFKIGSIYFLEGVITFDSTQTNQGNMYIDESSLPLNGRYAISGGGGGAESYHFANNDANKNTWIAQAGVGRINATQSGLAGSTVLFNLIAVPKP